MSSLYVRTKVREWCAGLTLPFYDTTNVHQPDVPDRAWLTVQFTALGDDKARSNSARALQRAAPFLRRQIGSRLRLKRVPELKFVYDESIAGQDRIERLLNELHAPKDDDTP